MHVTRFAASVQFFGADGRRLRRVPPAEAQRLVRARGARVRLERGGRVLEIETVGFITPIGPASTPRLTHFTGQRYTRTREIRDGENVIGHVVELKPLRRDEQTFFLQTVIDCGGGLVRRSVVQRRESCTAASS